MKKKEVFSAYDNQKIGSVDMVNEEQAFAALQIAYGLHSDRSKWLLKKDRLEILKKTAQMATSIREELALQAAKEGGKPLTDSLVEVDRGIEGIYVAIEELSHLHGTEIPMGINAASQDRLAFSTHEPRGVVLAISAFNHPFNLIIHQVIPAVAAGCPVLIKPASSTPLSCQSVMELLHKAGLPKKWCQMILCDVDVVSKLVCDERISFLTFIGSAKVGWHLRSILAPGANCALEHGGVAPVILDKSANFDKALPLLLKGGYYHAGQVCVSVQRVYVHESIVENFSNRFAEQVKTLKVGDPIDKDTQVGPLISYSEVERVHEWVTEAISAGAKCLAGGKKKSNTCYAPTLLLNPPDQVQVSQQEIFGPVVCIYSYKTEEEALLRANSLNVAFQAAVFTEDLQMAFRCVEKLNAMAVMINDHTAFRVDWMPFGGYKKSGLGVGGIGHSLKDMCVEKMFVIKKG